MATKANPVGGTGSVSGSFRRGLGPAFFCRFQIVDLGLGIAEGIGHPSTGSGQVEHGA